MTDWDKELAKIDKQLASMSDAELTAPVRPPLAAGVTKGAAAPASAAPVAARQGESPSIAWGVVARLGLSVALGVSIVFWPYDARCGAGLMLYLAAVAAVVVGGVWSAVWSWKHRAPRAHVLALLLTTWGLVLGGMDILPRAGYARPTALHPAEWACK